MFLISKCRGDWDLGLYTTSVLAFGELQRNGKIRKKNVFLRRRTRILPLHCGSPNTSTIVVTTLDLSLLYILISGTYSQFARKNNFLALGVYFLQPCSSADRRFAASRSRVQNYRRITTQISMKCVVNWIPLRIRVCSRNTQPHLNHFRNQNLVLQKSSFGIPASI